MAKWYQMQCNVEIIKAQRSMAKISESGNENGEWRRKMAYEMRRLAA